jgi:hypothetical protein
MVSSNRKPTVQRLLLFAGIVLFVPGVIITVGIPPIESVPDIPELGETFRLKRSYAVWVIPRTIE